MLRNRNRAGIFLAFLLSANAAAQKAEFESEEQSKSVKKSPERIRSEYGFAWLRNARMLSHGGLHLVFVDARRLKGSPSEIEVRFRLVTDRDMPLEFYSQELTLVQGHAGRELIQSRAFGSPWKKARFGERDFPVSLIVRNSRQDVREIYYLKLKLNCKQLGRGRSETVVNFGFRGLPITN